MVELRDGQRYRHYYLNSPEWQAGAEAEFAAEILHLLARVASNANAASLGR